MNTKREWADFLMNQVRNNNDHLRLQEIESPRDEIKMIFYNEADKEYHPDNTSITIRESENNIIIGSELPVEGVLISAAMTFSKDSYEDQALVQETLLDDAPLMILNTLPALCLTDEGGEFMDDWSFYLGSTIPRYEEIEHED